MILPHKHTCETTEGFQLCVCKNRTGYYVGYVCSECQVSHRESGYYNDEPSAWKDWDLVKKGQPMTNPRPEETEEEQIERRLKNAGGEITAPEEGIEWQKVDLLPARVLISSDGGLSIEITDPLGSDLQMQIHLSPWGVVISTATGFNNLVTEDGFLVMLPASKHEKESARGILDLLDELRSRDMEITETPADIDAESTRMI